MDTDNVFFRLKSQLTPEDVADIAGGSLEKYENGAHILTGFAGCDLAQSGDIIFIDNKKYMSVIAETKASCILLSKRLQRFLEGKQTQHIVLCDNARLSFVRLMEKVYEPKYTRPPGLSGSAIVHAGADIGENVTVGEYTVIEQGVKIGAGTKIGHHVTVGAGVVIGEGCEIADSVTICHTIMGNQIYIASGTRIGQHGFGMIETEQGFVDMPHNGRVVIEDNVVIGANVSIDRGTMGDTVVGEGCRIGDFALVSHNVQLGKHCAMAGQSGIAGSTIVGDYSHFGGQCGIAGHLRIGSKVRVLGQSGVLENLEDGSIVAGTPSLPAKKFFKLVNMLKNLGMG